MQKITDKAEYVPLPTDWSDWTVTEKIGEGSFGTVYVVEKDGEEQALKVIEIPADDGERAALLMETKSLESAQIYLDDLVKNYTGEISTMYSLRDDPHIVRITDHLVEKNQEKIGYRIFIRMELLTSLRDHFAGQAVTQDEVIRLGMDICDALTACDQHRIIHRDIKPDNIFISEDGFFKLGDFGTARQLDLSFGTYSAKGTYTFMAPEVYRGERYNKQVDIYSLGMVLYRLLNRNRDPFVDPEKQLILYQEREEALQRRMDGDALPSPLDASENLSLVIRRACAFHAKYRYPDAASFKAALQKVLSGAEDFQEEKEALQCEAEEAEGVKEEGTLLTEGEPASAETGPGKRLIILAAAAAGVAILFLVLILSGVIPIGRKPKIAVAAPADEAGQVLAREQYEDIRQEMEEPMAAARTLMEELSGMSMREFDTFSSHFVNGDDELLSVFLSSYREYPNYAHHLYTALGTYVTEDDEDIYYIGITGYKAADTEADEEESEIGSWEDPGLEMETDDAVDERLPVVEEYPWILCLCQTDGEWRIDAQRSRADNALEVFRNDGELYPESFMDAMANDQNRVRMNENNYSYLDGQAVYAGLLTWDMKFAWQDEEGNLFLSILLRNGTDLPQEVGEGTIRLNDKKLGMVAQAQLPIDVTVETGENAWLTFRIDHQDVAGGTSVWTDITPVLSVDTDSVIYLDAPEYGTEAMA